VGLGECLFAGDNEFLNCLGAHVALKGLDLEHGRVRRARVDGFLSADEHALFFKPVELDVGPIQQEVVDGLAGFQMHQNIAGRCLKRTGAPHDAFAGDDPNGWLDRFRLLSGRRRRDRLDGLHRLWGGLDGLRGFARLRRGCDGRRHV